MSASTQTSGQNSSYVPISASLDLSDHSYAVSGGTIGSPIILPPGTPGGDAFAFGGSSGILKQILVGVAVFVIATYAMKHLKKV